MSNIVQAHSPSVAKKEPTAGSPSQIDATFASLTESAKQTLKEQLYKLSFPPKESLQNKPNAQVDKEQLETVSAAIKWVTGRTYSGYEKIKECGTALLQARSFNDIQKALGTFFSSALETIREAVLTLWEKIKQIRPSLFETGNTSAAPLGELLKIQERQDSEIAAEKKEKEKLVLLYERFLARAHEASIYRRHDLELSPVKMTSFSKPTLDRSELANLKHALMTNSIPSEKMPEVQRFLASLEKPRKSVAES